MTLRRCILFGCTAAALVAQDFPVVDTLKIQESVRKSMEDAQHQVMLAQERVAVDQFKIDESMRKAMEAAHIDMSKLHVDIDIAMEKAAALSRHEWADSGKVAMAFAKEARNFDKAFAMQFNFNDNSKGRPPLTADEEMKIMAIDAIMQNDAERAIPLVDKVLQNQQSSIRLRLRALQALARSSSSKAWDIIARVAKDGSNTEMQSRALQLLGSREGAQNRQLMNEIYAASSDADIKRQVLRSWASAGQKEQLVNAAKSDSNLEVREAAIRHLGDMRANQELGSLYTAETNPKLRERILRSIANTEDWQRLLEIAKTEKDEELRNRAIQYAGSSRAVGASDALAALYSSSQDTATRGAILRGLSQQRNAKQLIALARKETDPELKRQALQHLTRMKGDEVTSYLTELLQK